MGFAGGKIEKVLAPQKELSFILTDSQLPLNLVLLKNIEVTGIHWGAYTGMYRCTLRMVAWNVYASLSQGTRTRSFRVQSGYQASLPIFFRGPLVLTQVLACSNLGR